MFTARTMAIGFSLIIVIWFYIYILLKSDKSILARRLKTMAFFILSWLMLEITSTILPIFSSVQITIWRVLYAFLVLSVEQGLEFAVELTAKRCPKIITFFMRTIAFISSIATIATNYFILPLKEENIDLYNRLPFDYGQHYLVLGIIIGIYLVSILVILATGYYSSKLATHNKRSISPIFFGMLMPMLIGFTTGILSPLFGLSWIPSLGFLAASVMLASIMYGIFRSQIMGIRSSIRTKIIFSMFVVSTIPMSVGAYFVSLGIEKSITERSKIDIKTELDLKIKLVQDSIATHKREALSTAESPFMKRFAQAAYDGDDLISQRANAEEVFVNTLQLHPEFLQIRYLDLDGKELLRADYVDGEYQVVSGDELQDKSTREYFIASKNLEEGQVYISPPSLNREGPNSEIVYPIQPVMRYVTPVVVDNEKLGYFIINVDFSSIVEYIANTHLFNSTSLLIDENDFFVYNPDSSLEWGGSIDLDSGEKYSISSIPLGSIINQVELLYSEEGQAVQKLILIDILPSSYIQDQVRAVNILILAAMIVISLSIIITSLKISASITRPINLLTSGIKSIEGRDYSYVADVSSGDEVDTLADAFNQMVSVIKDYQTNLELKIEKRTEALEKMNELMVGRELKMVELKKKLESLGEKS